MYNFLYINTHDTGRHISPYGFQVNTPSLLNLAKDGTLFTKAYSCAPTCSPSRAAMLTSTMPHTNGMMGLAQRGFSLVDPKQHLASYLSQKGFETAICGIQHEVGWYFDIDKSALHEIGYENILTNSADQFEKENYHLWDRKNAETLSDWFKKRKSDKPFMVSYGLHSTHRPYPNKVAENIDARYVNPAFPFDSNEITRKDQSQFLTSAQSADENIGIIIKTIKELGLYENTVILFTTDHGLALPYHKCNLRDDGIGVSMIFRHPTKGQGKVIDNIISQLDVFPTICDVLEIEKPSYLTGVSFIEMLDNEQLETRTEVFAESNFHTSYEPIRCVRTQRYKYVKYFDLTWDKLNLSNIDEAKPKEYLLENGLQNLTKDMEAFYDCLYDPSEKNNLIDNKSYQPIINDLKERLQAHLLSTNDPILNGEIEVKPNYKVNIKTAISASSTNPNDYDPKGKVN